MYTIARSVVVFALWSFVSSGAALAPSDIRVRSVVIDSDIYTINNASKAYTWKNGYPQSCECVESYVSSASCDLFKCTCSCDLTAGMCDYSCCCDPDCSDALVSRFQSQGFCDSEGYTPSKETVCYSSDELQKVNPRSPMGGQSTSRDGLDELLCVEKNNNFHKGNYYEDIGTKPSTIFNQEEGKKDYDYTESLLDIVNDLYYDENDTIPAFTFFNGSYFAHGAGYMSLPQADFSGYCNDNNYVKFENNVEEVSCVRSMGTGASAFEATCNNGISVDYLATNLALSSTSLRDSSSVPTTYVTFTIDTIYFLSNTGEMTDITSTWQSENCATQYQEDGSDNTYPAECKFGSSSSSDAVCRNAVTSIEYVISHDTDAASTIVNASTTIIVMDIPFEEEVSFKQSFSVEFASSGAASGVSKDNGNLVKRGRSGNPGYLPGLPVLFGTLNSTVIFSHVDGFQIPAPLAAGRITCPTVANHDDMDPLALRFGYDATTGCVVSLTRSELEEMCCEGASLCVGSHDSPYTTAAGLPAFFETEAGYVGIYGNADPLDVSQWLPFTVPTPSTSNRRWQDTTSTCSNMIIGMNYKFLLAYSGEKVNPQTKIIAAAVEYVTGNWKFKYSPSDSTSSQSFPLTVTASFIYTTKQDIRGYTPPPPPILLSVPYDVFYPFDVNAGQGHVRPSNILIVVAALVVAWVCGSV